MEVLKFSGEVYEIRVLSSDGEIKVGINEIRVEVNPPAKVEEFYLYMPGMPEMREYVSMEGSWQVRVKIGGRMIYKDINVPIKGGSSKEHEHSSKFDNLNISLGRLESPRN